MRSKHEPSLLTKVLALYPDLSPLEQVYIRLRFSLLGIADLERYLPEEGRIVDLGCGYGYFSNVLAVTSIRREVLGVDLDANRVEKARRSIGKRSGINFLQQEISGWSIPACEGIAMVDLLHYFPRPVQDELLDRCYYSLAPGGKLLLREVDVRPRVKFWFNYLHEWLLTRINFTQSTTRGLFFRSSEEISGVLRYLGFTIALVKEEKITPYSDYVIVGTKQR
jgi:2-polyprenyl-3-methyl-5-hydroxy-6-metoxy-1,4-benzoquinol methylase